MKKIRTRRRGYSQELVGVVDFLGSRGISTVRDLSKALGVTKQTIAKYCRSFPEFRDAVARARQASDTVVENSLLALCKGVKVVEEKNIIEKGRVVGTEIISTELPPNLKAIQYWLRHRAPDIWGESPGAEAPSGTSLAELILRVIRRDDDGIDRSPARDPAGRILEPFFRGDPDQDPD